MTRNNRSRPCFRARVESLEDRRVLSFAGGTGPVVTSLIELTGRSSAIVVSFDGPLNASLAEDAANYAVNRLAPGNPEIITRSGPSDPVVSAIYNPVAMQVTLTLAKPLQVGTFYRVMINGTPGTNALTDVNGVLFDGDNDATAGGDFYGLVAAGTNLKFMDSFGNRGVVKLSGGGQVDLWRELNGDVDQLTVVGAVAGQSTLTGSVIATRGGTGIIVIPSYQGLTDVNNLLPPSFGTAEPAIDSPLPIVANSTNLPYSLQITNVSTPGLPSLQATVYGQANGLWLLFGGRTNGLHGFNPTGQENFPPHSRTIPSS
jgi:hypothetical protein